MTVSHSTPKAALSLLLATGLTCAPLAGLADPANAVPVLAKTAAAAAPQKPQQNARIVAISLPGHKSLRHASAHRTHHVRGHAAVAHKTGNEPDDGSSYQPMLLSAGTGHLLHLSQPASTVFVSDPTVADVQVPAANTVFILGKKAGTTTLFALDSQGLPIVQRSITVSHNLDELRRVLSERFPTLRLELKSSPGSLMVSGAVGNAQEVAAVTQTLQPYLSAKENLINQMALSTPTQVNLRVRVAEVNRTILQQIGINWFALGGLGGLASGRQAFTNGSSGSTVYNLPSNGGYMAILGKATDHGGIIDMLDQESLITTLAEPNLTAVSGETASFLAGGEYPIPVAQTAGSSTSAAVVTVEYKDFGVGLNFTPTVLANNRISLKVNPEVSSLDSSNSVTFNGITIPGLKINRVNTTVELGSGQSFVIGGLLQDDVHNVVSRLPGLGSLPILGRLFSSTDYQNGKTELVVIVTPYLVHPVGPDQLQTGLDNIQNPSDVEAILLNNAKLDPYDSATPHLAGNAGFAY